MVTWCNTLSLVMLFGCTQVVPIVIGNLILNILVVTCVVIDAHYLHDAQTNVVPASEMCYYGCVCGLFFFIVQEC